MIRLTHRAKCTCGWARFADAEAQAEVEGEAHLRHTEDHLVVVEKVRTWEEESDGARLP